MTATSFDREDWERRFYNPRLHHPSVAYGTRADRQPCTCGHQRVAHQHLRAGTDCAAGDCGCARFTTRREAVRNATVACAATLASVAATVLFGTGAWWWADQAWKAIR